MSQVKVFVTDRRTDWRTDRRTDEWVLMSPAFAKGGGQYAQLEKLKGTKLAIHREFDGHHIDVLSLADKTSLTETLFVVPFVLPLRPELCAVGTRSSAWLCLHPISELHLLSGGSPHPQPLLLQVCPVCPEMGFSHTRRFWLFWRRF